MRAFLSWLLRREPVRVYPQPHAHVWSDVTQTGTRLDKHCVVRHCRAYRWTTVGFRWIDGGMS